MYSGKYNYIYFYSKNNFKILTCWLRLHIGFSPRIPKITWILGGSPGVLPPHLICVTPGSVAMAISQGVII